ncbi:cytochrome P450 [Massariosphaeria phaeospora]|uniref:Cytochrome P450 n=1 Tax=Massariosphaeria phaeospora TaxID=100035 RepID=A0A7C8I5G2_9PLEO|nr:cytochrome P450 [Massariosphaeria phaeospora]
MDSMDPESLGSLFFWVASVWYVCNSWGLDTYVIKGTGLAQFGKFLASIKTVLHDFRSAKYYKPWNTAKPIVVSTKKQIAELSEASVLSQRAVYADMFGFKHTLNNFDHNEVTAQKSRLFGRLIQVNGVANLPKMFPFLAKRVNESLDQQIKLGKAQQGGVSVPIAQTIRTVTSRVMGVIFFGENLSSDPVFSDALLRHPKEMVSCMAAFQITPSFLSPFVHNMITKRGEAQDIILKQLAEVMGPGRDTWNEESPVKELTLAWNMAELTKESAYWQGSEHLAQSLLGIWFAAAHQPWMNLDFIMLQLSARPDIQEGLRQEIGDLESLNYDALMNMPFLDSFIKETVRLHPLDTMAVRRKALKDYTFAGGAPYCPSGSTVCVSSYDLMHNETDYPKPHEFQPRRFVDTASNVRGTKFTEVSEKFPVWGYGSLACPGRFHASIVMKLIISHIVMRYDLELEDDKARTLWSWETFTMPYESTRFVLKERAQ